MEVLILCFAVSSRANSSSRSRRRAVRTRFAPPAANSFASATPIPALAPVISAHFPRHSEIILFASFSVRAPFLGEVIPLLAQGIPPIEVAIYDIQNARTESQVLNRSIRAPAALCPKMQVLQSARRP